MWGAKPNSSDATGVTDYLNKVAKYVVSSTLEYPVWNNSTVLTGSVVDEVSRLKREVDGDIVVPASVRVVRTLLEHDLIDELRLKVFPVVLGAGEMRLVDVRTLDGDTAFLIYRWEQR